MKQIDKDIKALQEQYMKDVEKECVAQGLMPPEYSAKTHHLHHGASDLLVICDGKHELPAWLGKIL